MKVKLPIFWHTDASRLNEDLGIEDADDDFSKYDEREVIFYNISGITKYLGENKHTSVFVGAERFICILPLAKVEELIDASL